MIVVTHFAGLGWIACVTVENTNGADVVILKFPDDPVPP